MWDKKPEQRIRDWRNFRLDLQGQDTLQCIDKVARFWATAPQSNQFLASDLPESWPNPWELLTDNYYDDGSVALGMYYTLVLLEDINPEDVQFNVLKTPNGLAHTVKFEEYILNYSVGEVVNTNEIKDPIVYQYGTTELQVE